MSFPVVKVVKHEFAKFLDGSADIATLWNPDNAAFEQFVNGLPCDVEELMTAIDLFAGQECDYVYIFNANLDDPEAEWSRVIYDDAELPTVSAKELSDYRGQGKDFLYFACSLEEAATLSYTTLLPGPDPADDEVDSTD